MFIVPTKVDINNANLVDLINNQINSIERISQFKNEDLWLSGTDAARGMFCLLGQHAERYFSPYCSAFLFEMKSLHAITYFSPLIVRDGAMSLMKFFYDNPQPPSESTLVGINDSLRGLVPSAWIKNVFTYKIRSNKKFNYSCDKIKILLLNTQLGPNHCTKEYLSRLYSKIKTKTSSNSFEIHYSSFLSQNSEDLSVRGDLAKHHDELLIEVLRTFQSAPVVKSPNELKFNDYSDFLFCDLNEFHFYYSDSYFYHSLLQQGAIGFDDESDSSEAIVKIQLSPYHEIHFFILQKKDTPDCPSQKIEDLLNKFRNFKTLQKIEAEYKPNDISFANKICTQSFEDFAYEVVKTYHANSSSGANGF